MTTETMNVSIYLSIDAAVKLRCLRHLVPTVRIVSRRLQEGFYSRLMSHGELHIHDISDIHGGAELCLPLSVGLTMSCI